jgi:hypothetical protein
VADSRVGANRSRDDQSVALQAKENKKAEARENG